jgi:hypothetical protein
MIPDQTQAWNNPENWMSELTNRLSPGPYAVTSNVSDSCEIGQNHHYSVKCTDLLAQNILLPTAANNVIAGQL